MAERARRICVFTGSRADYGLLRGLIRALASDPEVDLDIVAAGAHLRADLGSTIAAIECDGFVPAAKIAFVQEADTPVATATALGLAVIRLTEALDRLRPDIVVVLGDRYEALAAAQSAMMLNIPIAHVHGGEATEGLIDEAVHHAISKMAHLHFTAAAPYRARVIQLGEHPDRVFNVGAPGLDNLSDTCLLSRSELSSTLEFDCSRFVLVTLHPVTLDRGPPEHALEALVTALDRFPEFNVIPTKSNADTNGRRLNALLDARSAERRNRWHVATSLGQQRYLSALALADAVVGNSSSNLIEAPSLGVPTVNIGERQRGRLHAPSVIDCDTGVDAIAAAVRRAVSPAFRAIAARRETPYGRCDASLRIAAILKSFPLDGILFKRFFDLREAAE